MTDPADADPGMPDALEVAAKQDAYFASTGWVNHDPLRP
jgi:hypothetical protein